MVGTEIMLASKNKTQLKHQKRNTSPCPLKNILQPKLIRVNTLYFKSKLPTNWIWGGVSVAFGQCSDYSGFYILGLLWWVYRTSIPANTFDHLKITY